jgi:uncharacterized protein YdhG (YjbR/CyaY superfamily)
MAEASATNPTTIDEYIAQHPPEIRPILEKIRAVVRENAPQAEERISYGMPGFYLNGGLVWFGAYKRHIGLYPRSAGMQALEGLAAYKGTKGSVHFPLDQPMPYELIARIVQVRVDENLRK